LDEWVAGGLTPINVKSSREKYARPSSRCRPGASAGAWGHCALLGTARQTGTLVVGRVAICRALLHAVARRTEFVLRVPPSAPSQHPTASIGIVKSLKNKYFREIWLADRPITSGGSWADVGGTHGGYRRRQLTASTASTLLNEKGWNPDLPILADVQPPPVRGSPVAGTYAGTSDTSWSAWSKARSATYANPPLRPFPVHRGQAPRQIPRPRGHGPGPLRQ